MSKTNSIFLLFAILIFPLTLDAQQSSFILLGDTHYDRIENHDLQWLKLHSPKDLSQIKGYTANTSKNWDDFMKHLRGSVNTNTVPIKAVIQLGDLSEGLAGDSKADQMAKSAMLAIDNSNLGVPWILVKGNHDVTAGSAARKAFNENYIPMIRKQTGNKGITTANYSYRVGNIEFFVCDYYERDAVDPIAWLDSISKASTATFKFALFHQPVIPVTERCWHMYNTDPVNRQRLLQVMAANKLIALVGHLHRYSVVRRKTPWGPIVQIMASSVISDRHVTSTSKIITEYGPSLADNMPSYSSNTLTEREQMLSAEQPYITYFKQCTLNGYGILNIDETSGKIILKYYGGFSRKPFDTVDISALNK